MAEAGGTRRCLHGAPRVDATHASHPMAADWHRADIWFTVKGRTRQSHRTRQSSGRVIAYIRGGGVESRSYGRKFGLGEVDAIIEKSGDWRGVKLALLRAVVLGADPGVIEEVKWKKPSRPEGIPVWSRHGIICSGEILKSAVRLTFPKGAEMKDPGGLFNTRLDSATVRAVDLREDDPINQAALKALILEAVRVNKSKVKKRR